MDGIAVGFMVKKISRAEKGAFLQPLPAASSEHGFVL